MREVEAGVWRGEWWVVLGVGVTRCRERGEAGVGLGRGADGERVAVRVVEGRLLVVTTTQVRYIGLVRDSCGWTRARASGWSVLLLHKA